MFEAQQPNEDKVFLGGKIKEPGFYKCEIVRAWEHKASTGSVGMNIELISYQGQSIKVCINTIKKDGDRNEKGFKTIQQSIMPIVGIKGELKEKHNDSMMVDVWEYDSTSERNVKTGEKEVKITSYPQLAGKETGIIVIIKSDPNFNGGKPSPSVDSFYHPDTRQSAHEFVNKLDAKACENRLQWVLGQSAEIKHIEQKAETNGKTATYSATSSTNNFDDFDDDLPF